LRRAENGVVLLDQHSARSNINARQVSYRRVGSRQFESTALSGFLVVRSTEYPAGATSAI